MERKDVSDKPLRLTEKGRRAITVGLLGGVFDILHEGHIATLEEAKRRCDLLVIVIARDETVKRMKGKMPVNQAVLRRRIIEAVKPVDAAILGDADDHVKPLMHVDPDIVFLGYDQKLPKQVENLKRKYLVERLDVYVKGANTSTMIKKISGRHSFG